MNNVVISGRLTGDPTINTSGEHMIARYTIATDRRVRRDAPEGTPTADFIPCVCFGRGAEFANNYLRKGMKMIVRGRLQSGRYQNREGQTVFTLDLIVEDHEFAESRRTDGDAPANTTAQTNTPVYQGAAQVQQSQQTANTATGRTVAPQNDSFMNIPPGAEDDLPFA